MPGKRVALLEFPVHTGIAPLASAYLEAVASQNPRLSDAHVFEKHVFGVDKTGIIEKVLKIDADVYGFSTYVWNSGLVKRIVPALVARRPNANIILGGPQVINKAESYLNESLKHVVVCNGEGEFTFSSYLEELMADRPDFSRVDGLSFYRDGAVVTTAKQSRIRNLDEIPSPFLGGYIDASKYTLAVFESNRGCPFTCTYCFWGAATNAKVHKFSGDRVLDELTWLCENRFMFLLFADANFGILERDVEIARHLTECKKRTGFPLAVTLSSSKNTPVRVTEITKILSEVGLIIAQPVSIQTMSPVALKAVDRANIKSSSYTELQRTLNESNLRSFNEIIWPLPGETLESFKSGIDQLCRLGSDSFVIYPLMLINNVRMDKQREEYELVTLEDPDPNSEAEIVISTSTVTNAQYQEGLNLSYHLACLYSLKALRHVMGYLDAIGASTFTKVATSFWQYSREHSGNPYTEYIDSIVASMEYRSGAGGFNAIGGAIHIALHSGAAVFDDMLLGLMEQEGWLADPAIRLRFEIDLLNRPLIYSNTPVIDKSDKLRLLRIEDIDSDSITVGVAPGSSIEEILTILPRERVELADRMTTDSRFRISYRTPAQIPFQARRPLDFFHYHCQYKTRGETQAIEPVWKVVEGKSSSAYAFSVA
jgi:radical SAM superfamily enzyme YgiQ (UPF0313 family)